MFYISIDTQKKLPDRALQILCLLPQTEQIIFEITYRHFQPDKNNDAITPFIILKCIIHNTRYEKMIEQYLSLDNIKLLR